MNNPATNIFDLPTAEKILLAEQLWNSVAEELERENLSEEEKNIIDERLKKYKTDSSNVISWDKVFSNLLNK